MIGFVSAFLGTGGGTLTVPYLAKHGVEMKNAVAISSACGFSIATLESKTVWNQRNICITWLTNGMANKCMPRIWQYPLIDLVGFIKQFLLWSVSCSFLFRSNFSWINISKSNMCSRWLVVCWRLIIWIFFWWVECCYRIIWCCMRKPCKYCKQLKRLGKHH